MRAVRTYAVWWIALFWLWLAYQGEWNRIEWIAAAGAATLGAALVAALASLRLLWFRVPLRVLEDAKSTPLQIVIDFGILTLALARRIAGRPVRGRFVSRSFESAGSGARAAGDRAARAVIASYSPNAYVVDIDPGAHTALLHDLVPNRRSEEPV